MSPALSPVQSDPPTVFKTEDPKRQIVAWDAKKALSLWQKRYPDNGESLSAVFEDIKDVTEVQQSTYLRNKLVLKPKNHEESMNYTTDE